MKIKRRRKRRFIRVNFGHVVSYPGAGIYKSPWGDDFPPDDKMNIFVLSENPVEAAQMQCDRHVVKMVLESAQLLSACCHHHKIEGVPLKATHIAHPCAAWVRMSMDNYEWLWDHMVALMWEYTRRYGKVHKYEREGVHEWLWKNRPPRLPSRGITHRPLCMPREFHVEGDPVASYRNYYIHEKASIARWKLGNVPDWFKVKH